MLRIASRGPITQPREQAQFKDATAEPLIRSISDGGAGERAASFVYNLTSQVLCAKSVPHADAISLCCRRRPLRPRSGAQAMRTDVQGRKSLSVMPKRLLGPQWVQLGSRDDAIPGSSAWHGAVSLND